MALSGPVIIARFLADTKQLTAAMATAEAAGTSTFVALGKQALVMGAILAAAFAIDFTRDAIKQATDLQESMNKVKQVFKESADQVTAWAENSAKTLGLSRQKALEAVSTFGNLAVAVGLPGDKVRDMSEGMVQLAADLGSFNNVPTEDALAAIQAGLVGQVRPLRRFGVNMSEATLKAEALRTGLVSASVDMLKLSKAQEASEKAQRKANDALNLYGENSVEFADATRDVEQAELSLNAIMEGKVPESLDAATRAQAAYSLMLQQTGTAHGDYARTADLAANASKTAGAEWDNLKAKIGTVALPALQGLLGFVNDTFIPGLESMGRAVRNSEAWDALGGAIHDKAIPALKDLGNFITDDVIPKLQSVHDWAVDNKDLLAAVFIGAAAAITVWMVPALISMIPGLVTMIIMTGIWAAEMLGVAAATLSAAAPFILIGAVVALLAFIIIKNWDTIKTVTGVVWDWITDKVSTAWDWIKNAASVAIDFLSGVWDTVQNAVAAAVAFITDHWKVIAAVLTGPIGLAVLFITEHWDTIKNAAQAVADFVVARWEDLQHGISAVIDFLQPVWDAFSLAWRSIQGAAKEFVDRVIGYWDTFKKAIAIAIFLTKAALDRLSAAWDVIRGAAAAVVDFILARWEDLRVGMGIVVAFLQPLWDGIQAVWQGLQTAAQAVVDWVLARWNDFQVGIGIVVAFLQTQWDNIQAAWQRLQDAAQAVATWITDRWNDLRDGIGRAIDTVRGYVDGAIDTFNHFRDEVGRIAGQVRDTVEGIARSLGDTVYNLVSGPINAMIDLWNKLAFDIPSFTIPGYDLPGLGHQDAFTIGGQHIAFPKLAHLAAGGVLTRPTLFLGGEAGPEIVAPEDMLRTIIAEESRGGNYTLNMYPRRADTADIAYGFRRLEMLAGLS